MQNQYSTERLDRQSYGFQLLNALKECSSLAEKHNRDLVPCFLSLARPEGFVKLSSQKLNAWLSLFSKFANPKALYSTETLHPLYVSLLSHPDRSIQTISLSCLLTYKSPNLFPHEDQLRALLDDSRWREELTSLELEKVEPMHRSELVSVIVRLLFGIMLERRGRTTGTNRRVAVLGALAGCTDEELGLVVDLMLSSIHPDRRLQQEGAFTILAIPNGTSDKQQIGFLTLLGDVLKVLGPRLLAYWPALLGTTIDMVSGAHSRIKSAVHPEE